MEDNSGREIFEVGATATLIGKIKELVSSVKNNLENRLNGKADAVHFHKSSEISSMNGYAKPSSSGSISASDSLNAAIGKLEAKLDSNTNTDRTTITVGETNLTADSGTSREGVKFVAGSNISLTPNTTNNTLTIASTASASNSRIHFWNLSGTAVWFKLFTFKVIKGQWGYGGATFSYASRGGGTGYFSYRYQDYGSTTNPLDITTYYYTNGQTTNVPCLYITDSTENGIAYWVLTAYGFRQEYSSFEIQLLSYSDVSQNLVWDSSGVAVTRTGTLVKQVFNGASSGTGTVTSVNGHTGAVTLTASDINAVSTIGQQGLTEEQKANARNNIGAGTSNLALGNTATTAAPGNHIHANYISNSVNHITEQNTLNWGNVSFDSLLTTATIAFWNGAYNFAGGSNLAYCNKGAFGTMATQNASDFVSNVSAVDGTSAVSPGISVTKNGQTINLTLTKATSDKWGVTKIFDGLSSSNKNLAASANSVKTVNDKIEAMPKQVIITEADYTALATKDSNTIYFVK